MNQRISLCQRKPQPAQIVYSTSGLDMSPTPANRTDTQKSSSFSSPLLLAPIHIDTFSRALSFSAAGAGISSFASSQMSAKGCSLHNASRNWSIAKGLLAEGERKLALPTKRIDLDAEFDSPRAEGNRVVQKGGLSRTVAGAMMSSNELSQPKKTKSLLFNSLLWLQNSKLLRNPPVVATTHVPSAKTSRPDCAVLSKQGLTQGRCYAKLHPKPGLTAGMSWETSRIFRGLPTVRGSLREIERRQERIITEAISAMGKRRASLEGTTMTRNQKVGEDAEIPTEKEQVKMPPAQGGSRSRWCETKSRKLFSTYYTKNFIPSLESSRRRGSRFTAADLWKSAVSARPAVSPAGTMVGHDEAAKTAAAAREEKGDSPAIVQPGGEVSASETDDDARLLELISPGAEQAAGEQTEKINRAHNRQQIRLLRLMSGSLESLAAAGTAENAQASAAVVGKCRRGDSRPLLKRLCSFIPE